jgi:hypothetical protein
VHQNSSAASPPASDENEVHQNQFDRLEDDIVGKQLGHLGRRGAPRFPQFAQRMHRDISFCGEDEPRRAARLDFKAF